MSESLSRRTTLLLVAVVFGLTFGVQALLAERPSATPPSPVPSAESLGADARAAEPDLRLVAAGTVPALREPRRRVRTPAHRSKPTVRTAAKAASTVEPAPVQPIVTPQPTPAATPRFVPTAPPRSAPAPKPKATPAPPASGEFDTSGPPWPR